MMRGRLYIDGKDAFIEYGAYVREGGYNELVAYAPLKKVHYDEWPESDGAEADLTAPRLDTKTFKMSLALTGAFYRLGGLIESLSDRAYHTFDFRSIHRTYRLRLVSHTDIKTAYQLGLITLQFADDFPLDGYKYVAPSSSVSECLDYELDDVPMTAYGVRVLNGTLDEIKKSPAVKQNLLKNIKTLNGAIYDGEVVFFKTKDVKIKCLMRANTLDELWRNYDALLYNLIQPEERRLYVDDMVEEYPCHYKSCQVSKFYPSGKIWLEFTLTLVFTSFRLRDEDYLLATEDNMLVITEDGENAIELIFKQI